MILSGRKTAKQVFIVLLGIIIVAAVYAGFKHNGWQWISTQLHKNTHPALILGLFVALPIVGFPISIFLILLGFRFGPWWGMAVMAGGIPLHLLASFGLSHSYFRPLMERFAWKRGVSIPRVPENRHMEFSVIFMAVPGLPYAIKNYMLALSGVPFRIFLPIGWGINALLGAPFVIVGGAATRWGVILPAVLIVIIGIVYGIRRLAKRKLKTMSIETKWTSNNSKGDE
ncbi:MAG: hypothetical protein SWH68_14355 [Thermodesulfobacteriota bacterium]|nr:hypothetical protein [Thermodesulfobacteriota bacterium]